jgi:conjugal transfer pilin signal peptidase TrbI
MLAKHFRRWGIAYLAIVAAALLFKGHFVFGINSSTSLPQRVFLIHKGEAPERGQYVAFRWQGGGLYPAGTTFVKILAGVPGDTVTRNERDFFVNGEFVGKAKTQGRSGTPLEPAAVGVIPPGRYFVRAPHPDSLDSRYEPPGLITKDQMIGRAYALF